MVHLHPKNTLDLQGISSGIYFLQILKNSKSQTSKIFISHQ
ncbi:MAG: T9SS type A sorting domain-containing protein [Bacteroidetes bacterium]|nr:T9SS type A sorting domain-containing protein [Bacteroidota bacterium]